MSKSRSHSPSPFIESVREGIRVRHYSLYTERAYVHWIRRFILFHGKRDLAAGVAGVWLPYALARKYPHAPRSWGWQFVVPASRPGMNPRVGVSRQLSCPAGLTTIMMAG